MAKIITSATIVLFCWFLFFVIRRVLIYKAYSSNKLLRIIIPSIPLILYIIVFATIIVSKKINQVCLQTSDWITIGVSLFETIVGYIIARKEQSSPTVYFNELIIQKPTFDQSENSYDANFIFYDNSPQITEKHILIVKEIRIYIVLIKEIFDNYDLFLKYKEDQQYVRSFLVTDKDCFECEPTNQKLKLTVSIKEDRNHYLKMYLQDNVGKFLDKSMIRIEFSYTVYKKHIKPINYFLEKAIWKMNLFKSTANKFNAHSEQQDSCLIGIKYINQ